jgi:hypothetical protein
MRDDGAVTITATPLARCTHRSCPWRWRTGPDRPCAEHASDDAAVLAAAAELGIDLAEQPHFGADDHSATADSRQ